MSKTKLLNLDMMSLQNIDEDSDLIPLMTSDDEEAILKESLPESLPILPLKNTVMFPGVVIPITASRDKSIKLIKDSNTKPITYRCCFSKRFQSSNTYIK